MASARKKTKESSQADKIRQRPLDLYSLLLLVTLAGSTTTQLLLTPTLSLLDAQALSRPLNGAFAILHSWILSGLLVCVLLRVWLNYKVAGLVLSSGLAILWALGFRRHTGSPSLLLYPLPLAPAAATFWAGLRYASRHLLPHKGQGHQKRAFDFLKKHIFAAARSGYVLSDSEKRSEGLPSELTGKPPSFVITGCDHTVAISDKVRITGVRDPGLTFLQPEERVAQVIDLRPQLRTFALTARTQDGIQIRIRASVGFQIDAGRRKPRLGEPLPFSKAAAFKALHAQRVEHETNGRVRRALKRRLWDDLPAMKGEHILRDIISKLNFDDLYAPYQLDAEPPRRRVAHMFLDQLQDALDPTGIQVLEAHLGNFEPVDPQVYLKRARNWQSDWARRITLTQAESQVERLQILERARADARTDLILDLGRQLESLAESKADLGPDALLDQFLVVLETLMTRPQLENALPERTKDLLSDMRESVGEHQRDATQ